MESFTSYRVAVGRQSQVMFHDLDVSEIAAVAVGRRRVTVYRRQAVCVGLMKPQGFVITRGHV